MYLISRVFFAWTFFNFMAHCVNNAAKMYQQVFLSCYKRCYLNKYLISSSDIPGLKFFHKIGQDLLNLSLASLSFSTAFSNSSGLRRTSFTSREAIRFSSSMYCFCTVLQRTISPILSNIFSTVPNPCFVISKGVPYNAWKKYMARK